MASNIAGYYYIELIWIWLFIDGFKDKTAIIIVRFVF
jgi:hypothetical protein